jgi:hypothetical protein
MQHVASGPLGHLQIVGQGAHAQRMHSLSALALPLLTFLADPTPKLRCLEGVDPECGHWRIHLNKGDTA